MSSKSLKLLPKNNKKAKKFKPEKNWTKAEKILSKKLYLKQKQGVTLTKKDLDEVKKIGMIPVIGRPTKYTHDLLYKAAEYANNWQKWGDKVPSICGLCIYLKITRKTAHIWQNDPDKEDFCYILELISLMQEKTLINKGLCNEFNSNIVKLMLSRIGYADKREIMAQRRDSDGREWTVKVIDSDPLETTIGWIDKALENIKFDPIPSSVPPKVSVSRTNELLKQYQDSVRNNQIPKNGNNALINQETKPSPND